MERDSERDLLPLSLVTSVVHPVMTHSTSPSIVTQSANASFASEADVRRAERGQEEDHWGACYQEMPSSVNSSTVDRPQPDYSDLCLYAFPSSRSPSPPISTSATSFLRLVKLFSNCLPSHQTVAILSDQPDGYTIGRDKQVGETEGRLRLRELEVSRIHACLYFRAGEVAQSRADRDCWWIVDQGSTHGTFLSEPDVAQEEAKSRGKGKRLSEPKKSGLPAKLQHMAHLTVGSTLFEVCILLPYSNSWSLAWKLRH